MTGFGYGKCEWLQMICGDRIESPVSVFTLMEKQSYGDKDLRGENEEVKYEKKNIYPDFGCVILSCSSCTAYKWVLLGF